MVLRAEQEKGSPASNLAEANFSGTAWFVVRVNVRQNGIMGQDRNVEGV